MADLVKEREGENAAKAMALGKNRGVELRVKGGRRGGLVGFDGTVCKVAVPRG